MPCACCAAASGSPTHRWFSPACLHCGARLIQQLATLDLSPDQLRRRRKAVLADWMAHGHAEQALRTLVKGPRPIGPAQATASAAPTPQKLPFHGKR